MSASMDASVRLWTGGAGVEYEPHGGPVLALALPTGDANSHQFFATGDDNGVIHLYDFQRSLSLPFCRPSASRDEWSDFGGLELCE